MKKQESLKQQAIRKAEKELRKAQEKALKVCTPNQQTLCGKEDCTMCFDRSLASHARGEFWSDQNGQHAGCIRRGSNKKGWFDCDACQHAFLTTICTVTGLDSWCPYCSNKILCDDEQCKICFEKSLASTPFAEKWSKNNKLTPRQVFKKSSNKHLFNCFVCFHEYPAAVSNVVGCESGCPYCNSKLLCDDDACKFCFEKSFASHYRAKYWSPKNKLKPRQVLKKSGEEYIFDCEDCGDEFTYGLITINRWNSWCTNCIRKGERKLNDFLKVAFPSLTIQRNPYLDWCRNPKTSHITPFDFVFPDLNLVIEVDGAQHFKQVMNWLSPEENVRRDCDKMDAAWKKNFWIIRLLQHDMFLDKWDWRTALTGAIQKRIDHRTAQARIIFLEKHLITEISNASPTTVTTITWRRAPGESMYIHHISYMFG